MLGRNVLLLVISLSACLAQDYCDRSLCNYGVKHIACPLDNRFGSACPQDVTVIAFDQNDINNVVKAHNLVRQKWANGSKSNLRGSACKMGTMVWDEELAKLAELNAKSCVMQHDKCHNTQKYRLSGQNLYASQFGQTGGWGTPIKSFLVTAVQMWAKEEKDVTAEDLESYPNFQPKQIGHLTVMINEKSIAVGCAAVTYKLNDFFHGFNMACNYAYTNMVDHSVYSVCAKGGSECPNGVSSQYAPLCA
ncbi:antigen 5 like allergen Cul n 1 [Drosophila ficusphila]|uniref:antigen 5 like allergen Cul n 1 n=1 Tax=Drosophila ficusphila TaxID=30025 RepID=UPI0007E5D441|nr:antigen 5 like allergen Cul n 1 [Drosophila ficusphila]